MPLVKLKQEGRKKLFLQRSPPSWKVLFCPRAVHRAPATTKRKAPATATAQGGVSSGRRKSALGAAWRNLTLPPFTYNSMAYGRAAAQAEEQPEERIATTTVTAPEAKPTKTASEAAYDDLLTTLESLCNEAIFLVSLNRLICALLCAVLVPPKLHPGSMSPRK